MVSAKQSFHIQDREVSRILNIWKSTCWNSRVSGDGQPDADARQLRVVALPHRQRLPRRRLHLHGHRPRLLDVLDSQPGIKKRGRWIRRTGITNSPASQMSWRERDETILVSQHPPIHSSRFWRTSIFEAKHYFSSHPRLIWKSKVRLKIQTFVSRGKSMDGMGKMKTSAAAEGNSGLAEWDKFIYTDGQTSSDYAQKSARVGRRASKWTTTTWMGAGDKSLPQPLQRWILRAKCHGWHRVDHQLIINNWEHIFVQTSHWRDFQ